MTETPTTILAQIRATLAQVRAEALLPDIVQRLTAAGTQLQVELEALLPLQVEHGFAVTSITFQYPALAALSDALQGLADVLETLDTDEAEQELAELEAAQADDESA